LQSIKASKQSPASVASIAFAQAVFGKHPYAHSKIGTPETIEAITLGVFHDLNIAVENSAE
jgi:zinc protease